MHCLGNYLLEDAALFIGLLFGPLGGFLRIGGHTVAFA